MFVTLVSARARRAAIAADVAELAAVFDDLGSGLHNVEIAELAAAVDAPDATVAALYVDTFNAGPLNTHVQFIGEFTFRQVFNASVLSTSGTLVKVHLQGAKTAGGGSPIDITIDSVRIVHAAAAGDPYDYAGTPTAVTFNNGSSSVVVPVDGAVISDPVTFALDQARNLVVAYHYSGSAVLPHSPAGTTPGVADYYKSGNDVGTINPSGYTIEPDGLVRIVNRIEVADVIDTFNVTVAETVAVTDAVNATASSGGILDGLTGLTGAWSMSRELVSAYAGSFYTDTAGAVSTLFDQSGNGRNLTNGTAGERPTISTAGPNSRATASFDGSNDRLNSAAAISTFIANNAGYIIISVLIDAITTNDGTIFNNDPVWIDSGNFCGVFARSTPSVAAYNFDGSADATAAIAITTGSARVIEWRHDGGNIMCRVNKGTWQSAASGNTQTMTGTLQIAADISGGIQNWIDMHLFEMAAFNVVPDATTRDAIVDGFMAWTGAV